VCVLGEGKQLAGGRWSAIAGGGGRRGRADSTLGEQIWSSFQQQKVEHGLLLLIHILCMQVKLTYILYSNIRISSVGLVLATSLSVPPPPTEIVHDYYL
jgi:hypothetical protein